ncbi:MAG: hypothetical protein EOP48_18185 [Sphingobacteriales bacterium]|nr:MAG: hypothetical protein EOP48_18185 [Sphingobacteriales bacterium]
MRTLLTIALITICTQLLGQSSRDTTIRKIQLDSMQNLIFRLKDSTKRLSYENRVLTQTNSIDTVFASKDSLNILYKSKSGKVLKRIAQTFRQPDCLMYETTEFMNRNELPVFTILFERSCLTKKEAEEGNLFDKLSYYYERKEYDSLNRMAVRVFWYPRMTVTRFEYQYDKEGKQSAFRRRITAREFWD